MSSRRSAPGLYGKVPIRGDFVSRRLPAYFVRFWDDWLQEALLMSREQLESAWLDAYLISPIWRFVLSAGNCGKDAWAGILMPSVDKVSRYFPLTLAAPVQQHEMLPWLFSTRTGWFDKLEALALSALEDDLDLDALDRELQETILMSSSSRNEGRPSIQRIDARESRLALYVGMGEMAQIRDSYDHLSACLLDRFLPVYSLWCTNGSEWVQPSLVAYDGLPPAAAYARLLTGHWEQGGWAEWVASRSSVLKSSSDAALGVRGPEVAADGAPMHWSSNSCSTVGCVRKVNEDSHLERGEIGLWAVADGMGGHIGGDVASKAVVSALSGLSATGDLEVMIDNVKACLKKVNLDLMEKVKEYGQGKTMGSTAVVLLAEGNRYAVVWAGDSRLYRYRKGVLSQITRDHSLAAELAQMGAGTQEELSNSAIGSLLTRAVGSSSMLETETIIGEALAGDLYMLCSDGMIREVKEREIENILCKDDFEISSRRLIDLALAHGARDNVTVVMVRYGPLR